MRTQTSLRAAVTLVACHASRLAAAQSGTSAVNFGNDTGAPAHLASGLLYGVPDAADQIPAEFYQNIGFNYLRAGGAQIPAPGRGWIWGEDEYANRFTSVLSNYRTAREYGAEFIFLIHDLYGCDGTQNSSTTYPGDNGSWDYWSDYLDHVISDMQSNDMIDGVVIDIWNEPDGSGFWNRDQDQYLQMWGYTYARLRTAFGSSVPLSGPASAGEPLTDNTWWQNYAQFISANDSVPDQYAWHMEGGGGDMQSAYGGLVDILATYDLPLRPVNINEYAVFDEQVPAGSAWWISQLERVGAQGLRGNWLSGYPLHDYMSSLLGKPDANTADYDPAGAGYWTNGDYQVFKYYYLNMTGHRVGTQPSPDLKLDTYATVGDDGVARVLVGVRITTGTWEVQLDSLTSLGLPASGDLDIHTWAFPVSAEDAHFGEVDGPTDLGYYSHSYTDGTVTFPIYQNDQTTAYAFEFTVG